MIKRLFRILLLIIFYAFLLVISFQLILTYPAFLFPEKLDYKNFTILSDEEVSPEMTETLDDISSNLLKTGFYDEDDSIKIILCNKRNLTKFFDIISLAPVGVGFHHFSGIIYLFPKRIDQFRNENLMIEGEEKGLVEHTYQKFQFDKVLTHEILHKLHSDSLGVWEFKRKMPPPHWKAEGFAEYYTFQSAKEENKDYDFRDRVTLYLNYQEEFPLFYYKSQLLYEFLKDYKHLDFVDIMKEDITEQGTYGELIKWYNTKNQ